MSSYFVCSSISILRIVLSRYSAILTLYKICTTVHFLIRLSSLQNMYAQLLPLALPAPPMPGMGGGFDGGMPMPAYGGMPGYGMPPMGGSY